LSSVRAAFCFAGQKGFQSSSGCGFSVLNATKIIYCRALVPAIACRLR
jgi:hypothetical protein